jgi:RNA polymerase sigma-70 factor (ECF subfamily)
VTGAAGAPGDVHARVEHLFRREAGRLVAVLTGILGPARLGEAEDLVQEALVRALREWPFRGVPANPQGWLVRVARNLALDLHRRDRVLARKLEALGGEDPVLGDGALPSPEAAYGGEMTDDTLRMVFTCCHPAVPADARVALTLKTVGGFGVTEIARAFLVREDAVAQRLVRAKRRLREPGVRFEVPAPAELPARLDSVLDVVYLTFNEGHAAAQGDELLRADVCAEAVRLARLLARHPVTGVPRAHALAALLLFHAARLPARVDAQGDLTLLPEQDRALWDRGLMAAGFRHLDRASSGDDLSPWHLEAGIAAVHAAAPSFEGTDWPRIVSLYDALLARRPSPVAALGRAVARAMVDGPAAALADVAALRGDAALARSFLLPAAEARLREMVGEPAAAADAYRRALALPASEPERRFLRRRLALLDPAASVDDVPTAPVASAT